MTDRSTKSRRWALLAALVVAGGTIALLAVGNVGENLVYYWSPSELKEAGDGAEGASVRLGGLVVPGSVVRHRDGLTLEFAVTDGREQVPVVARTVPPAMFREGIGVVVEGSLNAGGAFETQRLMVKHDNEYKAPDEGEIPEMDDLVESMRFDTSEG